MLITIHCIISFFIIISVFLYKINMNTYYNNIVIQKYAQKKNKLHVLLYVSIVIFFVTSIVLSTEYIYIPLNDYKTSVLTHAFKIKK